MPELLSCFLFGTQLSKTKQEEESLGRFLRKHISVTWGCLYQLCSPAEMIGFLQVCMTCIRCKSCGVTPGKSWDTEWNHDKGLCPDCSKLYEQGQGRFIYHFFTLNLLYGYLCLAQGCLLWLNLSDCLFLLGNYCPICFKCYEDNDYDSQMMQCGTCNHWVHAKCEDLTGIFVFFSGFTF